MTTKEFMDLIGVTQQNTITKYLKSGVLNPKKLFGAYIFSSEDVFDYNEFKKTGIRKYTKILVKRSKDLKSVSTRELVTELYNRTNRDEVLPETEEPELDVNWE